MKKLTRKEFLANAAVVGLTAAAGFKFLKVREDKANCLRPPGALPEDDFLSTCIRCGRCGDACPNRCIGTLTEESGKPFSIVPGTGEIGTPVIYPRLQACNMCNGNDGDVLLCTAACPTGALQFIKKEDFPSQVAMGTAQVDTNLCYSYNGSSCGVCVRACPLEGKALRAGHFETPIIDPEHCVGCGLCERACIRYPQAVIVTPDTRRAT